MNKKLSRLSLTVLIVMVLSLLGSAATVLAANPSANLDQCANDPAPSSSTNGCNTSASQWVNGNLGSSKAVYLEGETIPYRLRFDNLGLASSHTVTIEWDTTKSSKHALDYITDFNKSVLDANPCLGVSGCSAYTEFSIPVDAQVTGAGITPLAGKFRLYGGTISSVSAYSYLNGTGFSGDKSARISITFTASARNPVLAWGGHISARTDWGANNSAVAISGSPYHTRLISLDGSGGNQDRSLSADAVIFPASITIIKDAVPDDAQDFSFSTTGGLSPATFSLDDDADPALSNTQLYANLINFTTYTVTEATVAHWTLSFGNPVCTVGTPNGGSQTGDAGTGVITINLKEGENVTCTFTNTHNVSSPSITTLLSSNAVSIGTAVHDSATLKDATSDAGGTVTYTVYSDDQCTNLVASAGTKTVSNGLVPDSDAVTFNSAGTFYWKAVYSGDANNNGATSDCISEQMVVNKNGPSIATVLSATSVAIGTPVHDTSTLTGATADAGGTVTYTVYSDSACSLNAQDAGTVTVTNGLVPDSNAITFNSAGTYYWQAIYSGDSNNLGATSACTEERMVVNPNEPSITTLLSSNSVAIGDPVHDTAALNNATADAGGTVTYTVYSDDLCTNKVTDAGTKTVTNGVVPDSEPVTFNIAGTYYWQAVYSGDTNNVSTTSTCLSEQLVVNPNTPTIATILSDTSVAIGTAVHDSAILTGATADAGGTVTYTVYSDSACSQDAQDAGMVSVTNGVVPDSNPITFNSAGTFYWQAVYSGDNNNVGAMSACTEEQVVVNKNQPSLSTAQKLLPNDDAIISGATGNAGGTITFSLFDPSDAMCAGTPDYSQTVDVSGNGTYSTTNTTFFATTEGTWRWLVSYSGDANNEGATSACGVEQFTIANH